MTARRYRQPTPLDLAIEDLPRMECRARVAITEALGAEFELEFRLLCAADGRAERWLMLAEAMRRAAEPSGWSVEGPHYGQPLIDSHNGCGGYLELRLIDAELVLISGWHHGQRQHHTSLSRHVFALPAGVTEAIAERPS